MSKVVQNNYLNSLENDQLINLYLCHEEQIPWFSNNFKTLSQHTSIEPYFQMLPSIPSKIDEISTQQRSNKKNLANPVQEQPVNLQTKEIEKYLFKSIINCQYEQQFKTPNKNGRQKNSNAIKKIGRIILDHLSQFKEFQQQNTSINNMIYSLSHTKSGDPIVQQYKKRDRFSTQHLQLLFDSSNPNLMRFNLRKTYQLLKKYLRKTVLKSDQIQQSSKLVYMNTMKCSALRCINPKLALRLQMSK